MSRTLSRCVAPGLSVISTAASRVGQEPPLMQFVRQPGRLGGAHVRHGSPVGFAAPAFAECALVAFARFEESAILPVYVGPALY